MNAKRGVTLVEVVIAAAVLIIMVALLMTVFFGMSGSSANSSIGGDLAQRGRMTLDRLRAEMQFARFSFSGGNGGIYNNHCMLRYQAPLSMGTSGTQVWGCIQPPNTPVTDGYFELGFVADAVYVESSGTAPVADGTILPSGLSPITLDKDLNLDGDKNDAFVRGRIVQRAYTSGGTLLSTSLIDDYVLLRPRLASGAQISPASLDGAIKSDAEATGAPLDFSALDPLFRLLDSQDIEVPNTAISSAARKLRVTMWHANLDHNERTLLLFRNQEDVRLENPQ
jgi:hypothetical protein